MTRLEVIGLRGGVEVLIDFGICYRQLELGMVETVGLGSLRGSTAPRLVLSSEAALWLFQS